MKFALATCLSFLFATFTCVAQQPSPNSTLLWRISGKGLDKPSWLFGTLHERNKYLFYFTDSVYAALDRAEVFAKEDDDEIEEAFIATKNIADYQVDPPYDSTRENFYKHIKGTDWRKMKRDLVLGKTKAEYMPVFVDFYFHRLARQKNKVTMGLEYPQEKEYMRLHIGDNPATTPIQDVKIRELNRTYYYTQDVDGVAFADDATYTARGKHIILNRRNQLMLHRIDSVLARSTGFFAVGLSHLGGDSGLINLIRKKGYTVTPVFSSNKIPPTTWNVNNDKWFTGYGGDSNYVFQMPSKIFEIPVHEPERKLFFCTYKASKIAYSFREMRNPYRSELNMPDQLWNNLTELGYKISVLNFEEINGQGYYYFICNNIYDGYLYKIRAIGTAKSYYYLLASISPSFPKEFLDSEETNRFYKSFRLKHE